MSTKKVPRKKPVTDRHLIDTWTIRAVVILQAAALVLGILAGRTLSDSTAVLDGYFKLLEILTQAS